MNLQELLKSGQAISITIGLPELEIFGKNLIQSAKLELEQAVISDRAETYPNREQVCSILNVDQSTLWRWAKRGYLVPVEIGGKRRYKMSDVKAILNGEGVCK